MLMITAKAIDFFNSVFMINKEQLESVKRLELSGGLLLNERESEGKQRVHSLRLNYLNVLNAARSSAANNCGYSHIAK